MSYKILNITIDSFNAIEFAEISIKENGITTIIGDNQEGKTTILKAIAYLFAGSRGILNEFIVNKKSKTGAAKIIGEIKSDSGLLYTIHRKTTGKGDVLIIKTADGKKINSPQKFLDNLFNDLSFNLFKFLDLPADKQLLELMHHYNIDFTDIDEQISALEQERLLTGRERDKIGEIDVVEKAEVVDISNLQRELNEINAYNAEQSNLNAKKSQAKTRGLEFVQAVKAHESKIVSKKEEIQLYEEKIKELLQKKENAETEVKIMEGQLSEKTDKLQRYREEFAKIPTGQELKDTSAIANKIQNALEINRNADRYAEYLKRKNERERLISEYNEYTQEIKNKRQERIERLTKFDTGISGMKLSPEGIFFNGNFIKNLSDAESLTLAAKICASRQAAFKILVVDRGESFDQERFNYLAEWSKDNDIQIIFTKVKSAALPEDAIEVRYGKIINEDILIEEPVNNSSLDDDNFADTEFFSDDSFISTDDDFDF